MQLTFNPGSVTEASSALAIIMALHPNIGVPGAVSITGSGDVALSGDLRPAGDDQPDPAKAFGAPDPATAFAPPLAAAGSPAPSTVNAGTSPIAAPAGESAPAVPASSGTPASSNGPTAATTPVAFPSSAPAGVDVDGEGLPWDKRIHSDPPKKNADGKWRSKRNLDDAVRAQVVAELRQVMGAPAAPIPAAPAVGGAPSEQAPVATAPIPAPPAPVPTPPVADTAPGPVAATTAVDVPQPPVTTAPAVPAAPVPQPPVADAAPAGPLSFPDLMKKVVGLQTAGTLTVAGTAEISAALGITGVRDLMHRPDLIPAFDSLLPVAA